jgi:hypothetical protein
MTSSELDVAETGCSLHPARMAIAARMSAIRFMTFSSQHGFGTWVSKPLGHPAA